MYALDQIRNRMEKLNQQFGNATDQRVVRYFNMQMCFLRETEARLENLRNQQEGLKVNILESAHCRPMR